MALSELSGDGQRIVFSQLCNVLEPCLAVALSGASHGLWASTQALRQQLKADHEVATVLCLKVGLRSCKELREAKAVEWYEKGLTATDLATLGTLGSVLPALERLHIIETPSMPSLHAIITSAGAGFTAVPDGMQRLVERLGTGALPAVTSLTLSMHVGDAGASALAAALGRGALPRLESLMLHQASIGDAGLVALAPALRRLPALEHINLWKNPIGDEGLAALVAPPQPQPAGALPPPTGVLAKLKWLYLGESQVNDAGCAALAAALNRDALPALDMLDILLIPASAAAKDAVRGALARSRAARLPS
eukprot:scaffold55232_cov63-Phaeocystis_antarctica.AAC.3